MAQVQPTFEDNRAAIVTTALDYIEGFYDGDAVRMERSLHPELAKRIAYVDPATERSRGRRIPIQGSGARAEGSHSADRPLNKSA